MDRDALRFFDSLEVVADDSNMFDDVVGWSIDIVVDSLPSLNLLKKINFWEFDSWI